MSDLEATPESEDSRESQNSRESEAAQESEARELAEKIFQDARQEFRAPKPVQTRTLIYILLFLLFIVPQFDGLKSVPGILVLVLVILFHEGGHMLGMRMFGFQDVRMYFIPFFGAAATGRPLGAAAWKHALVSLFGPLPGLVLGLLGLFFFFKYPHPLFLTAIQTLLLLNVFNLLPFGGLDGGRFLQSVLFSRHRVLEIVAFALGSAALVGVAISLGTPMLGLFALLGLLGLPQRWRILKAAAALRTEFPHFDPDPKKLSEAEERALFDAALGSLRVTGPLPLSTVAATMHSIADATPRPPRVLASLGLILLYLFTWVVALVGIVLLAVQTGGPVQWKFVEHSGWRAEFPAEPHNLELSEPLLGSKHPAHIAQAVIHGVERFTIEAVGVGSDHPPAKWMDAARDRLLSENGATLIKETPVTTAGITGRESEMKNSYRVWYTRIYVSGNKLYRITASAPSWGENQRRFFDSLSFVPSSPSLSPAPPDKK